MKPDVVSGLVNAGWPVLLLDEAGVIHHANPAAVTALGAAAGVGSAPLANFWLAENTGTPAAFLARAETTPGAALPLRLRGDGGAQLVHQACVCSVLAEGRKWFILQLLPQAPEAKSPSAEANLAQKQKLD